jgi:DNA-binding transcriptional regulator YiaG
MKMEQYRQMARPPGRANYTTKELRLLGVPEWLITIRALRRRFKLSLKELAAMLNLEVGTLQRLETGKHRPSPRSEAQLKAFAERWKSHAFGPKIDNG